MKPKILICDDHLDETKWYEKLEAIPDVSQAFKVDKLEPAELIQVVQGLTERRLIARDAGDYLHQEKKRKEALEQIDTTDILIVDYDLVELKQFGFSPSGEDIAYLARCYSTCGTIVALNQIDRGFLGFDLKLTGGVESFADLNIGDPALDNLGLWSSAWQESHEGYRPWYWPLLPLSYQSFKQRVQGLLQNLDTPILSYLGFPEEVVKTMSRSVLEFITTNSEDDPQKTTFRDFVGNGNQQSVLGLRRKDRVVSDEAIARVAAARISHWLERIVLPGQHILVDAPHLVSRYPSLIEGDRDELSTWNATTSFDSKSIRIKPDIIDDYRFRMSEWLSRPAWYWPLLTQHEEIEEVSNPWTVTKPPFVFCEDISRFALKENAREFVSDVTSFSSPFSRRYIKYIDGDVRYRPRIRLSM
ncbi:MAG: hypothetical protein KF893_25935 [Caldilineaceae bacterium]|nr:hypothetical protein [Caldilineaceae bacterium]